MKLNRSQLIHFINAAPDAQAATWFKIGKDVEDMSVDMNATIETQKNILDETSSRHEGYEPSFSVDTYFADPEDSIYDLVESIALQRLKGDACKTQVLEVVVEDTAANAHEAYLEDAIIEVTSYGGSQGGVRFPYTVHFAGNRVPGTATITGGVPTFTPST